MRSRRDRRQAPRRRPHARRPKAAGRPASSAARRRRAPTPSSSRATGGRFRPRRGAGRPRAQFARQAAEREAAPGRRGVAGERAWDCPCLPGAAEKAIVFRAVGKGDCPYFPGKRGLSPFSMGFCETSWEKGTVPVFRALRKKGLFSAPWEKGTVPIFRAGGTAPAPPLRRPARPPRPGPRTGGGRRCGRGPARPRARGAASGRARCRPR